MVATTICPEPFKLPKDITEESPAFVVFFFFEIYVTQTSFLK